MGKNEARRQKQLAKKKAKRQEKRAFITRETSKDPTVRFAGIAAWPVHEARMTRGLWSNGIGHVIVARPMPNGEIAMGSFVVDVYCLGVKRAIYQILSRRRYAEFIDTINRDLGTERISPEYAAKLVTKAVAFAESFGFAPDAEYRLAKLVLLGIDPEACPDEMTFGREGKPYYIRGPHESMSRAYRIGAQVQAAGGHFVMMLDNIDDETADLYERGQINVHEITRDSESHLAKLEHNSADAAKDPPSENP